MADEKGDESIEQELKEDFSRWAPDAFEEGLRRCFQLDWIDENGRVEVVFRVQVTGLGPSLCQLKNVGTNGGPTIAVRAAGEPIDDEFTEDFIHRARLTFEEKLRQDFRLDWFDEHGRIEFVFTAELAAPLFPKNVGRLM